MLLQRLKEQEENVKKWENLHRECELLMDDILIDTIMRDDLDETEKGKAADFLKERLREEEAYQKERSDHWQENGKWEGITKGIWIGVGAFLGGQIIGSIFKALVKK